MQIISADYLHTWISSINVLTKSKRAAVRCLCRIAIRGCFSAEIRYLCAQATLPIGPLFRALATWLTSTFPGEPLLRVPGLYYSQVNSAYYASHVRGNGLYQDPAGLDLTTSCFLSNHLYRLSMYANNQHWHKWPARSYTEICTWVCIFLHHCSNLHSLWVNLLHICIIPYIW